MRTRKPNCPDCGWNDWVSLGVQTGPGHTYLGAICATEGCGRLLHEVHLQGYSVIMAIDPKQVDLQEVSDYINTTLTIQARAYKAEWQPVVDAYDLEQTNTIKQSFGVDLSKGCTCDLLRDENGGLVEHQGRGSLLARVYKDNEGNRIKGIDDMALYEALWAYDNDAGRRGRPSMVPPPEPLNVPLGVVAFVLRPEGWVRSQPPAAIDSVSNLFGVRNDPLPPDPLRVRWDAFWTGVFDQLATDTGLHVDRQEIPNRYYPDPTNAEPWWTFNLGGITFTIGPRKRVFSIEMSSNAPFSDKALSEAAAADSVTFSTKAIWQDAATAEINQWLRAALEGTGDFNTCSLDNTIETITSTHREAAQKAGTAGTIKLTIHAWSRDKLIEYLTLAFQTAVPQP